MDFGSSKPREGSLMQPLVDFGRPPGISRRPEEVPPEGPWMPGTPTKNCLPFDMDTLWKNHPSLPPGFAASLGRTGTEKEMSHDSQDSGKVEFENGGHIFLDESSTLEEFGYGSSNRITKTWDLSPATAMISFTELLALAEPLPIFSDSQESTVVSSKQLTNAESVEVPNSHDHEHYENGESSPPVGIASSLESVLTDEIGREKKIGLNKKKRQRQQKPKKKKLRPKVVVDYDKKKKKKILKSKSKPKKVTPKTPKPLTPKKVISNQRMKGKRKSHESEVPEEMEPPKKSCKKGLGFELEMEVLNTERSHKNANQIYHRYRTDRLRKSRFDLDLALEFPCDRDYENENEVTKREKEMGNLTYIVDKEGKVCGNDYESLQVYRKGPKNIGYGFPKKYRKKRSKRKRRAVLLLLFLIKAAGVIRRKKRSKRYNPRRNLDSLFAAPICEELPWKLGERPEKTILEIPICEELPPWKHVERPEKSILEIPICEELPPWKPEERPKESILEIPICEELPWKLGERQKESIPSTPKTERPATTPSKRKGKTKNLKVEGKKSNTKGRKGDSIDSLVQKLETLSINDTDNQLVPYGMLPTAKSQAKKFIGKVDLDPETMKMWDLLVLESRNGGVEEEINREEKRWEQERLVFRERANLFLSCMHLLQGDRRFQPWKGSVLDSVVGVYLTQNVSDKLSSSAFMTMVAQFPLHSTTNDNECCIIEEDNEEDEDEEVVDENRRDPKSSPHELITSDSCSAQCHGNEMGEIEIERKDLNISQERKGMKNIDKEDYSGDWDRFRRTYSNSRRKSRSRDAKDSVDWEAVRAANVHRVANAISIRGMNNVLAARIKDFLDRIVRDHGSLDLEWLRDAPPEKAKEYLLSFRGLGLKSVECLRLLTLHHHAFPVDTNVARITVRLGWVPLQPLPSDVYIHNLDQYPPMDTIQKYLWPRLCTLDQKTLYELHYQMITFGKVFCTKRNPYCHACPLRAECKHYLSSIATRLPLLKNGDDRQSVPPFPGDNQANTKSNVRGLPNYIGTNSFVDNHVQPFSISILDEGLTYQDDVSYYEPIIEMPASPEPVPRAMEVKDREDYCMPASLEPVRRDMVVKDIEDYCMPASLEPGPRAMVVKDIEDFSEQEYDEIPTIVLPHEVFEGQDCRAIGDQYPASQALVNVSSPITPRKLKNISRLRTEHYVYELPDSHRLLIERGMRREPCDPCPFLLAIWSPGETADSFEPPERRCKPEGSQELCKDEACSFCSAAREQDSQTIRGTLLIPCRTAMRGSFPLNGTYFQVNEVFADDESSHNPIIVHRAEIWDLNRRIAYFGTSTTSIFRGLPITEIHQCFWKGFICVRGFDRKSRAPKPLARRLHIVPSHIGKTKAEDDED